MAWSAPTEWERWDPDKLMDCPYDPVHRVPAKRYSYHVIKCRENHPDKDFVSCPFNAKHIMLRPELRRHVTRCPDRGEIEPYSYRGSTDSEGFYFKGDTSVPSYIRQVNYASQEEDWDLEDDTQEITNHQPVASTSQHANHFSMSAAAQGPEVRDVLSLSPKEREEFKRSVRSQAVQQQFVQATQKPSPQAVPQTNTSRNPVFLHGLQAQQEMTSHREMHDTTHRMHRSVSTPSHGRGDASSRGGTGFVGSMNNDDRHFNSSQNNTDKNWGSAERATDSFEDDQFEACTSSLPSSAHSNNSTCIQNHPKYTTNAMTNTTSTSTQSPVLKPDNKYLENEHERGILIATQGRIWAPRRSNVVGGTSGIHAEEERISAGREASRSTGATAALASPERTYGDRVSAGVRKILNTESPARQTEKSGDECHTRLGMGKSPPFGGVGRAKLLAEAKRTNFGVTGNQQRNTTAMGRGRGMLGVYPFKT